MWLNLTSYLHRERQENKKDVLESKLELLNCAVQGTLS